MNLSKDITSEIEQLVGTFECSKDYSCYKSKFKELCEAVVFGDGEMIECIDKQAPDCQFSSLNRRHTDFQAEKYVCKLLKTKEL